MRRILVSIVVFIAVIMIVFGVLFYNRIRSFKNLVIYNDIQVSMAPIQSQTEPQLLVDANGAIYEWSNHTLQKLGERAPIVKLPTAVFPVSEGVSFIKEHCLYHWTSIETELISDNVSIACWDGAHYVWLDIDHCRVFEMTSEGKQLLLRLDETLLGEPEIMLASSRWVILGPYRNGNFFQSLLIYDRQNHLSTAVSVSLDGCDYAFLCEDKLIKIGGDQDTLCCLDLISLEKTDYESGIVAGQGDITASAAYDQSQDVFYVSVCSKPEQPEFYDSNAATIAINLQNGSIDIINHRFYSCLGIKNGSVYGIEKSWFGSWKTVILSNK